MLVDRVVKYYDKKYDLNCAECMLIAVSEEYNLNISKESLKLMGGFGGGLGVGNICGALTGGSAAIGLMFIKERGHKDLHVKAMCGEFIEKFKEEMSTIDCIPLKEKYFNDDSRCLKMMICAATALEEIINKYKNQYL